LRAPRKDRGLPGGFNGSQPQEDHDLKGLFYLEETEMYGVFSKNGNQLYVFKNETEAKRYTESAPASRIYLGFLYSPINPEIAECGKMAWL
jgi:hypothetical protein